MINRDESLDPSSGSVNEKVEPLPLLARHPDSAAVGFNNHLANDQSKACAFMAEKFYRSWSAGIC